MWGRGSNWNNTLAVMLGCLLVLSSQAADTQAASKRRSNKAAKAAAAGLLAAASKSAPGAPVDLGAPSPTPSAPDAAAGLSGAKAGTPPTSASASPADGGTRTDAGNGPADSPADTQPPPPMPQVKEELPVVTGAAASGGKKGKKPKTPHVKPVKTVPTDIILESQNQSLAIARRYAQLLSSGRWDEARLMHEEEGGRRPDWSTVRAAVRAHNEAHGTPSELEQHLVAWTGAELLTYFFTAHYPDGSELPIRVALDHHGNVSGVGVGSELVPAIKKRYDRYDGYKTRNVLSLPFYGTWIVTNATPGAGNGHYLNANQRFAMDFLMVDEVEPGKRKSHRDRGKQNTDYFAFGQDVLAPADGTVIMVVDGVPDNVPGQVDIYYRLGNSVVISLGNSEYAHLCHLQNGSMQVRVGDKVSRGQVVAKCGNSGNSTTPHLHFQLTDAPLISHAASLPAYFSGIIKDGVRQPSVLPQSGDHLTNPASPRTEPSAPNAPPRSPSR